MFRSLFLLLGPGWYYRRYWLSRVLGFQVEFPQVRHTSRRYSSNLRIFFLCAKNYERQTELSNRVVMLCTDNLDTVPFVVSGILRRKKKKCSYWIAFECEIKMSWRVETQNYMLIRHFCEQQKIITKQMKYRINIPHTNHRIWWTWRRLCSSKIWPLWGSSAKWLPTTLCNLLFRSSFSSQEFLQKPSFHCRCRWRKFWTAFPSASQGWSASLREPGFSIFYCWTLLSEGWQRRAPGNKKYHNN